MKIADLLHFLFWRSLLFSDDDFFFVDQRRLLRRFDREGRQGDPNRVEGRKATGYSIVLIDTSPQLFEIGDVLLVFNQVMIPSYL